MMKPLKSSFVVKKTRCVAVSFLCFNLMLGSLPAESHCLKKDLQSDSSTVKSARWFLVSLVSFGVFVGCTAYSGVVGDKLEGQIKALSYNALNAHTYYCNRFYVGNWLDCMPSTPCMDFVNQCWDLNVKNSWAMAGLGVGFFLDVVSAIGMLISGQEFYKASSKAKADAQVQQQKYSHLRNLCPSELDNADKIHPLQEVYLKLLKENNQLQLTVFDVYLHIQKGLETDELCPKDKPMTEDKVTKWLSEKKPWGEDNYGEFIQDMKYADGAYDLVVLHSAYNKRVHQFKNTVEQADGSIDGVADPLDIEKVGKQYGKFFQQQNLWQIPENFSERKETYQKQFSGD
jgi:hypothetical protein